MLHTYTVITSIDEKEDTNPLIHWLKFFLNDLGQVEFIQEFDNNVPRSEPRVLNSTELNDSFFVYDSEKKNYCCLKVIPTETGSSLPTLVRFPYIQNHHRFIFQGQLLQVLSDASEPEWKVLNDERRAVYTLDKNITELLFTASNPLFHQVQTHSESIKQQRKTVKTQHFCIEHLANELYDTFRDEPNALSILINMPELFGMSDKINSPEYFSAIIIALLKTGLKAKEIVNSGLLTNFFVINVSIIVEVETAYQYLKDIAKIYLENSEEPNELQEFLQLANTTGFWDQNERLLDGLNTRVLDGENKKLNEITARINIYYHKIPFVFMPTESLWEKYTPFKKLLIFHMLSFQEYRVEKHENGMVAVFEGNAESQKKWEEIRLFLRDKIDELTIEEILEICLQFPENFNLAHEMSLEHLGLKRVTQLMTPEKNLALFNIAAPELQWKLLWRQRFEHTLDSIEPQKITTLVDSTTLTIDNLSIILALSNTELFTSHQENIAIQIAEFCLEHPEAGVGRDFVMKELQKSEPVQTWLAEKKEAWLKELWDVLNNENFILEQLSDNLITLRDYYASHTSEQFLVLSKMKRSTHTDNDYYYDHNDNICDAYKTMDYPSSIHELYSLILDTLYQNNPESFQLDKCLDIIFDRLDSDYSTDGSNDVNNLAQIVARMRALYACPIPETQSTLIDVLLIKYPWEHIVEAFIKEFMNPRLPKDSLEKLITHSAKAEEISIALLEYAFNNINTEIMSSVRFRDFLENLEDSEIEKKGAWVQEKEKNLVQFFTEKCQIFLEKKDPAPTQQDITHLFDTILKQIELLDGHAPPQNKELIQSNKIMRTIIRNLLAKEKDIDPAMIFNTLFDIMAIDDNDIIDKIAVGVFLFQDPPYYENYANTFKKYLDQKHSQEDIKEAFTLRFSESELEYTEANQDNIFKAISLGINYFSGNPEAVKAFQKQVLDKISEKLPQILPETRALFPKGTTDELAQEAQTDDPMVAHPVMTENNAQEKKLLVVNTFVLIYNALPPSSLLFPHGFLETIRNLQLEEQFTKIQEIKNDQKAGTRRKQALELAEKFVNKKMTVNEIISVVYLETYLSAPLLFRNTNRIEKNIFSVLMDNYKQSFFHTGKSHSGNSNLPDNAKSLFLPSTTIEANTRSKKVSNKLTDLDRYRPS